MERIICMYKLILNIISTLNNNNTNNQLTLQIYMYINTYLEVKRNILITLIFFSFKEF